MPCLVRVSEAASLALHSMALLARNPDQRFSNQAIAEKLNASTHHLAKVMQMLVKSGLVRSQRGPQGGFLLNASAAEIQLLQIYEAVDGPISHAECLLHHPKCNGCICMLGNLVSMLQEQIHDCLTNTTLAELSRNLAIANPPLETGVPCRAFSEEMK